MATLLFPEDPEIWKANICEPNGMINWIKEGKKTKLAPWMTQDQFETHGKIMQKGGFTGPLNWYDASHPSLSSSLMPSGINKQWPE